MSKKDIVDCFCGDDEDDGTMMFCEKCKHWQHAICVNWNSFTAPKRYICPRCLGIKIECECDIEGDYQHAVIQCSKCHTYQHKRHVGFGIGKNPQSYVCSRCSSAPFIARRSFKIDPITSFFPSFNEKIVPKDIDKADFQLPPGKLLSKLREFSYPIDPVHLVATLFTSFKDMFFISHPIFKYFKFVKYSPSESVEDACQFFYYFTKSLSYMTSLSIPQIIQVIDHSISLTVYKKALPKHFRELISKDADNHITLSERAEDIITEKIKIPSLNQVEPIQVQVVAGRNAFPTVVATCDIRNDELICYASGYCMDLEEIDQENCVPEYTTFNISGTNLFIDSSKAKAPFTFLHIRRGIVSNCELRLFRLNNKGKNLKRKLRVGIFAHKPTLMQRLIMKPLFNPKKGVQSIEINEDSPIAIHAGEEIILPFDIPPTYIKPEPEWRLDKSKNVEINYDMFLPVKPSILKPEEKRSIIQTFHFEKSETEEPKQDVSTLQSLFGKSRLMNFTIEDSQKNEENNVSDSLKLIHGESVTSAQIHSLKRVIPNDPMIDRKYYSPKQAVFENYHEFNSEFINKWNNIPPPKIVRKPEITPAGFWKEDPDDFIDVSEKDLIE